MSEFFDYDPSNGLKYLFDVDQDGKVHLHTEQDVEPYLERSKALADEGMTDGGIKSGWWHYADIPPIVILQLRQKGIDVFNPNDQKRVFEEINKNYPYCKTTHKTHNLKG